MAKRLNVSLAMTADSSQAKAELNKLQLQLENLMKSATKSSSLGLTKDIREGVEAAAKLKVMFQQATDESGKLNLDKFNTALKSSGQSLSKYADKLIAMGPEGSKAFSQIARSIMNAEIPLKRTNAMLSEFATTLKNTVRWQISSSVLHGFMGSLQSAYGYAQNLDESLNNIRIVTNKSTDEMAKFAIEANKSAQALSTTTTRYTEAALIFYQQGLEGKDVTDRTDTVIKMANVTGEAAKDVSSYMTAIWNNFDDGSQSIEHYADVLTALGAATASSTAEISAGLEKFASIADVTGLSYDYAASALATLIANTRQSADVVGTSLKTIFSRMEGLKFGETLEDGVDLNKYSEALAKIGVNVLDVTGNLKDLDDILDDTAERWGTLSRTQQMATAQTVAGVRQYNNFISLMDNWDDMEDNLQTAKTSDGTLQNQADIYAESWEAARNRVRAAAEEIYNALLDEKFFISLLNAFEKILNTVKNTIDGLGGLPGVLTWVAAAMLQAFGPQISKQISDTWYNLTYSTEKAEADLEKLRKTVINTMQSFSGFDNYSTTMADVFRITSEAQDAFLVKNQELQAKGLEMDTLAKQEIQTRLSQVDTMGEEISKIAEKRQAEEEEINTLKQRMAIEDGQKSYDTNIKSQIESLQHLSQANSILTKRVLEFKGAMDSLKKGGWTSLKETMLPSIQALQDSFKDLDIQGNKSLEDVKEALMKLPTAAKTTKKEMKDALDTLWDSLDVLTQDSQKLANSLRETFKSPQDVKALNDLLDQMISHFSTLGNLTDEESQKLENLKKIQGELKEQIKNAQVESITFATGLVTLAQGLSSIAMTIQSIQSLGSIWNDDDKTTGEKILATMTTMGMIVPILTRTLSEQNLAKLSGLVIDRKANKAKLTENTLSILSATLKKNESKSSLANAAAKALEKKVTDAGTASLWSYIAAQMVNNLLYAAIVAVILILIGVVAALTKAWNSDAEAMKKDAESARAEADAHAEVTQGLIEENDKVKQLVSAYNDLDKQYKNGSITLDTLRSKTYKLCTEQGKNNLAVETLTASYEELAAAMREAEKAASSSVYGSAKEDEKLSKKSALINLKNTINEKDGGSALDNGGNTIDLKGFNGINSDAENEFIQALNSKFGIDIGDGSGHISTQGFLDAATENRKDLQNFLTESNLDAAEQLLKYLDGISDDLDGYEKSLELQKEYGVETIGAEYREGVKDAESYYDAVHNMAKQLQKEGLYDDEASALSAAKQYMIAQDMIDNIVEYAKGAELMDALVNSHTSATNAKKYVQQLSTDAQEFLLKNIDLFNAGEYKDTDSFFNDFQGSYNIYKSQRNMENAHNAISNSLEDKKVQKADREALYNNHDFAASNGISQKSFAGMDYSSQMVAMADFYMTQGKLINETRDANVQAAKDARDAWKKSTDAAKVEADQEMDNMKSMWEQISGYTLNGDSEGHKNLEFIKGWLAESNEDVYNMTDSEFLDYAQSTDAWNGPAFSEELKQSVIDFVETTEKQLNGLNEEQRDFIAHLTEEEQKFLDPSNIEAALTKWDQIKGQYNSIEDAFNAGAIDESMYKTMNHLKNLTSLADNATEQGYFDIDYLTSIYDHYKDMNNQLAVLTNQVGECENVSYDWNQVLSDIQGALDAVNGSIDSLQAAYKDLNTVVEDYNTNGYLTMDNLQTLLSLDDAYLNTLEFQNGQLQLNNLSMEAAANAMLDNAEALAIDAAYAELMTLSTQSLSGDIDTTTTSTDAATSATYDTKDALEKLIPKLKEGKQAWIEYYKAATVDSIKGLDASNDKVDKIVGGLFTKLSLIESTRAGLGKDFKSTMTSHEKSSSKKKEKDPEFINYKKLSDAVERYHEIEEALEDINRELERIDKTESRTYGKGRMSALKSKIDGYKNEAAALERYAAEAEKYLKEDSTKASQAGWKFDESGNVSNYEENLRSITEKYNQTIAAYNAMTVEQQEEYKKQLNGEGKNPLQQAEEEYKNALDALKQYEETADKYQDIQDKILENRRNIADAQLEEIELTVELNLEVDERNIALLEELFENIGDSADYVVDKIENIEKRIDAVVGKVETTRQAMKDTFDLLGEYNDNIDGGMLERMLTGNMTPEDLQNIADAVSNSDGVLNYDEIMSNIKDYADNLMEYNQELRDLRASVYDELENAMDKYSEEFDKVDDKIAHSKKMLSGYKDIVSALGKANVDPTGTLTRRLNENTIKTNESDWRAANARQEAMKKAKADAEEGLRKAKESGSEYDIERWTKILEKAQEDLVSAEENAQDKLVEWIESIGEAFKAEIEQVIEDLDKELGGLTVLRENFDRQQTLNEQYVDDYEKIYQLSKMTRDINKTIDETDNVNAKKALMEFQQKINKYQEDGVQMSQYEVENLQRQLELEKAKIQLDEAKDAKNQVRMQRDAEGNYGYIYTANETDVAAAEQNYEDKLHEIQVANGSYINELQDSIITMQEECSAKIKEIMLDESLSMEERMAKVEETRDYYQKRLEYYSGQLGIVLDNNKELYENEWLEYSERTGYKISRNEDYVDSWQETSLGILTETENQAAYMERVEEAIGNATDRMAEAMENYQDRTSEAMDQAGYDIDNLAEDIGDRSDEITEDAQNAADEAERLEDEYEQHLGDAMDATIDFTENYGQAIQDCIDENNRIIDSINDVIAALAEMASTAESSYNNINIPNVPSGGGSDTPGAGGGPGSGESGGSGSGGGGGNPGTKDYYVVIADTAGGKGNGHIYGFSGNHDKSDCESYLSQHKEDIIRTGNYNPRVVTRKSILGYDTGGYTGSWGSSEGKLAFLHQKELVLNAADTQNMLDIVDMVRDISRMIDINALSSMITSGLTTASVNTNNHDVIEQHVEITAEFHDATTATEITDAFENLINRATQYANRK